MNILKDVHKDLKNYISSINCLKIGECSPETKITRVERNLYHLKLDFNVTSDIQQDDWHLNINPAFKSDFHWAPHLTPDDNDVIDQHAFRAPAVIFTGEEKYIAVIPDLEMMPEVDNPERRYMDMNALTNTITLGCSRYRVRDHVIFEREAGAVFKKEKYSFGLYIMVSESEDDIFNPWRRPMQFLWEKHGSAMFAKDEPIGRKDLTPFVEHTYNWAFNNWDQVWQEFEIDGKRVGAPAFIIHFSQSPNYPGEIDEREMRSVWNQAWFSSLRSASGLFRYAKQTGNEDLLKKAKMTKDLALAAPMREGFFPAVIETEMEQVEIDGEKYKRSKGWETARWGNSNRNPYTREISKSPYHILDMSWTALLMLRWYEELEQDSDLLDYASEYAESLIPLQDKKGFFPGWLDYEDLSIKEHLNDSPESAMSVTFLLKLYEITKDSKYKDSALKAMDALLEEVIPDGRWEDFETYWSCCAWGHDTHVGNKVERNDMYKQCNFSTFWTAEALLEAYKITNNEKYLKWGHRTIDELVTHQAVWQPPYMYVNVFGGFAVMNCDGEWIDARQSLFAELIMEYGKVLGVSEYTERGLAAMRASFSMMYSPELPRSKKQWEITHPFFNEKDYGFMMENYGHGGHTSPEGEGVGVFTIYDWGNGAAAETWNRLRDHYGIDFLIGEK